MDDIMPAQIFGIGNKLRKLLPALPVMVDVGLFYSPIVMYFAIGTNLNVNKRNATPLDTASTIATQRTDKIVEAGHWGWSLII